MTRVEAPSRRMRDAPRAGTHYVLLEDPEARGGALVPFVGRLGR